MSEISPRNYTDFGELKESVDIVRNGDGNPWRRPCNEEVPYDDNLEANMSADVDQAILTHNKNGSVITLREVVGYRRVLKRTIIGQDYDAVDERGSILAVNATRLTPRRFYPGPADSYTAPAKQIEYIPTREPQQNGNRGVDIEPPYGPEEIERALIAIKALPDIPRQVRNTTETSVRPKPKKTELVRNWLLHKTVQVESVIRGGAEKVLSRPGKKAAIISGLAVTAFAVYKYGFTPKNQSSIADNSSLAVPHSERLADKSTRWYNQYMQYNPGTTRQQFDQLISGADFRRMCENPEEFANYLTANS